MRLLGSVVSVRFSPSGRFLATGSDDTVCLIWEFDPHGAGGMGSFGSSEQNVSARAGVVQVDAELIVSCWRPPRSNHGASTAA